MILITGGTGYIGSHTAVELISSGHDVVIADNLSNSKVSVLDRIEKISGRRPDFVEADIRQRPDLQKIFSRYRFEAVIHFAGLKAVGESVAEPLKYYDNNVTGSLSLITCMAEAGVKKIVFSSSATVYGEPASVPIREDFPLCARNPYGRTKLIVENILRDVAAADPEWHIGLLRYFNPVGAHPSGMIGEDPLVPPNNLMPCIAQVALGRRKELSVYGNDYPTADGTAVRDYIHVIDAARGHVAAFHAVREYGGVLTVNLGTGRSHSVLDVIRAFSKTSGKAIPYHFVERRSGDIAQYFADPTYAFQRLGWQAQLGIEDICTDSWRWQKWADKNLTQFK